MLGLFPKGYMVIAVTIEDYYYVFFRVIRHLLGVIRGVRGWVWGKGVCESGVLLWGFRIGGSTRCWQRHTHTPLKPKINCFTATLSSSLKKQIKT